MSKNYFEITYQGPFKGVNTSLPEDVIPADSTPFMNNFILKNGEIRSRPRQSLILPATSDKQPMLGIQSFLDQNNVIHTVTVTQSGLWQLNRNWVNDRTNSKKAWQLVGSFLNQPGPNFPFSSAVFINKFFWTNGGSHLWMWDGIGSIGAPRKWAAKTAFLQGQTIVDTNGKIQVATASGVTGAVVPTWATTLGAITQDNTIPWAENGLYIQANAFIDACVVDAQNGITAGGYFLVELNSQLLLCNTVESNGGNFPQRIRWCASGLPTIWDPNVNIGAGYNDELDVPDVITGAFSVGTTAFILRNNGITEITSNGSATNPFTFNHLWASKRGIGNALPFGYASYGPLGIFIADDDIYSVSMGGFEKIGGGARDDIYNDLNNASQVPIGSIVPYYARNYVYIHYRLAINQGNDVVYWIYSIEDKSWQRERKMRTNVSGQTNSVFIS